MCRNVPEYIRYAHCLCLIQDLGSKVAFHFPKGKTELQGNSITIEKNYKHNRKII